MAILIGFVVLSFGEAFVALRQPIGEPNYYASAVRVAVFTSGAMLSSLIIAMHK